MSHKIEGYASDVSDEEWAILAPLVNRQGINVTVQQWLDSIFTQQVDPLLAHLGGMRQIGPEQVGRGGQQESGIVVEERGLKEGHEIEGRLPPAQWPAIALETDA